MSTDKLSLREVLDLSEDERAKRSSGRLPRMPEKVEKKSEQDKEAKPLYEWLGIDPETLPPCDLSKDLTEVASEVRANTRSALSTTQEQSAPPARDPSSPAPSADEPVRRAN